MGYTRWLIMRRLLFLMLLLLAAAAACRSDTTPTPTVTSVPTPTLPIGVDFATVAPVTAAVQQVTSAPPATDTPAPTPTAVLYSVAEGDTLVNIAAQLGVTLEEILALNPGLDPNVLQIGQQLVLPPAAVPPAPAPVPGTPMPQQITVRGVASYRTPTGGLWLLGELVNEGQQAVENVQLRIDLVDAGGAALASAAVWAAEPVIAPQASAPFAARLDAAPDGFAQPVVAVTAVDAVIDLGNRYLELTVVETAVDTENGRVTLEGQVQNVGETGAQNILITATFYDAAGRVTGYAQQRLDGTLAPGAALPLQVTAVPPGGTVSDYRFSAQGVRAGGE